MSSRIRTDPPRVAAAESPERKHLLIRIPEHLFRLSQGWLRQRDIETLHVTCKAFARDHTIDAGLVSLTLSRRLSGVFDTNEQLCRLIPHQVIAEFLAHKVMSEFLAHKGQWTRIVLHRWYQLDTVFFSCWYQQDRAFATRTETLQFLKVTEISLPEIPVFKSGIPRLADCIPNVRRLHIEEADERLPNIVHGLTHLTVLSLNPARDGKVSLQSLQLLRKALPQLQRMHLEKIYPYYWQMADADLTSLMPLFSLRTCHGLSYDDALLPPLASCKELRQIGFRSLPDMTPVPDNFRLMTSQWPSLQALTMQVRSAQDLTPLKDAQALRSLMVCIDAKTTTATPYIAALAQLKQIKNLWLQGTLLRSGQTTARLAKRLPAMDYLGLEVKPMQMSAKALLQFIKARPLTERHILETFYDTPLSIRELRQKCPGRQLVRLRPSEYNHPAAMSSLFSSALDSREVAAPPVFVFEAAQ
jgi:hypothetical protein